MAEYVRLSALVDGTFTIEKFYGYQWKKWDDGQKRMLTADKWAEGYDKRYEMDTDKGKLELSKAQVGQCLEAVLDKGTAVLEGKTFAVKSNNKTGKEIRYFINRAKEQKPEPIQDVLPTSESVDTPIDLSDIPY